MASRRARGLGLVVALVLVALGAAWLARGPLDPRAIPQAPMRKPAAIGVAACRFTGERADDGSCQPRPSRAATTRDTTIPSSHPERGWRSLAGSLTLPASAEPRPGVLLLGGSGPTARDGVTRGGLVVQHEPFPLLASLADALAAQGLVVLRYDKRTCQRCYGRPPYGFRFHHLRDDALDALDHLAKQPEVDASRLVVLGHSQGGQLAPFVAAARPAVGALVLLAASFGPLEETLLGQLETVTRLHLDQRDPWSAAERELERRELAHCFRRLREDFEAEEICVGGGITQAALREGEELFMAAESTLTGLTIPVLALQGGLDRNVLPTVATRLSDLPHTEVHRLADLGHSFVHPDDRQAPRLDPRAIQLVLSFLGSPPPRF